MNTFNEQFRYGKYLILGCSALAMLFSLMTYLSVTGLFSEHRDATRPNMELATASNGIKCHLDPSPAEVSLSVEGKWTATAIGEVPDLEQYLIDRSKLSTKRGYSPVLRLRIPYDAPASFIRDATTLAERLGYSSVYVAVKSEQKQAQQVVAPDR